MVHLIFTHCIDAISVFDSGVEATFLRLHRVQMSTKTQQYTWSLHKRVRLRSRNIRTYVPYGVADKFETQFRRLFIDSSLFDNNPKQTKRHQRVHFWPSTDELARLHSAFTATAEAHGKS
jgi:hypothetical protein